MKKTNNKGFSLVELIIVVAIMAVLVGVLAPQYIKYLDKSKVGADKQLADNLKQAITTTILDPTITDGLNATNGYTVNAVNSMPANSGTFWNEVYAIMGVNDYAALQDKLKLEQDATITFKILANKQVAISVTYSSANTTYSFEIE